MQLVECLEKRFFKKGKGFKTTLKSSQKHQSITGKSSRSPISQEGILQVAEMICCIVDFLLVLSPKNRNAEKYLLTMTVKINRKYNLILVIIYC